MKRFLQTDWLFVILLTLLSLIYIWGIKFVPFHPDEVTNIYMSSDFDVVFSDVSELFWQAEKRDDARQGYRELDAPITKYLIGIGRTMFGQKALDVDWNWSMSWDENINAGAYPDPDLLLISRLSITILLPVSLLLMYSIGKQIQGKRLGLVSALLLGTNALVLLHGRRAMTEGPLLMGVTLAIWSFLRAREKPWLVGLGLAVAFNAKHTGFTLVPIGICAIIYSQFRLKTNIWMALLKMISMFIFITALLNPLYWNNPIQAVKASIEARRDLVSRQIEDLNNIAPDRYLETPAQRLGMMLANIYIGPAEHSLVGNLHDTQKDVDTYISIPGHNMFRGVIWGAVFFILTIAGMYMAMRNFLGKKSNKKPEIAIIFIAAFFQGATLLTVPLPWVRFTIQLLPFVSFFAAYNLVPFIMREQSQKNARVKI